jgi:hypothetical protein
MKAILTIDEVRKALDEFRVEGKKPTLAALYAALGQRGSMSTLVRLKAEIEGVAQSDSDSPDGLKMFRELWAVAVKEGRKQQDTVIAELRENLNALAAENERLEGVKIAGESRAAELAAAASNAQAELANFRVYSEKQIQESRAAFASASAQAAAALEKLSEAQASHACQMATLQLEKGAVIQKAHGLELELARAHTVLEMSGVVSETRE